MERKSGAEVSKLTARSQVNGLIMLFLFTYMASYMTRINYGAVISEMELRTGISRGLLSLALTGSSIAYGCGQILSGISGDRVSPKRLISIGLSVSALMNLLIPLCKSPYLMLVIWCVNGGAQAFLWPPMVKLMATLLSEEDYKRASVRVSWGGSFGTIAVYLLAPVLIMFTGWKSVFVFSALFGIVMLVVWNRRCVDIGVEKKTVDKCVKSGVSVSFFSPIFLGIMLAIVFQGMLRDGVITWMPTYISETYQMSNLIAILTGVILPLFSILSFQVASRLYQKLTNPLTCAGVIFGIGAAAAVALILLTGRNAAFSVAFLALLTGSMHGVNLILICMIPPFYQKYGNVSTVSGVLNSCTYVGSAISTYGIAVISEQAGWDMTLKIWLLIAALGTATCFVCVRGWSKEHKEVT